MTTAQRLGTILLAALASAGAGCATKVLVPPRIDLGAYGTIGMIEFSSERPNDLTLLASREFVAAVQAAQPGVPILELGDAERVLAAVERDELDPEAMRAIGEHYGVDAVVVGDVDAHKLSPKLSVNSLVKSMNASASLEGTLNARILETRAGATVWTCTARDSVSVASVSVTGSLPRVGATDPDGASKQLVSSLVSQATWDFRAHYERR